MIRYQQLISSAICVHLNPSSPYRPRTSTFENAINGKSNIFRAMILILILSGDIQLNPGPNSVYPCGFCQRSVRFEHKRAICCDECSIWYHSQCIEDSVNKVDIELLQHPSVAWLCTKCHTPNIDSFTYHSYELETTNQFSALSKLSSIPSIDSSFSPTAFSSPKMQRHLSSVSSTNSEHSVPNAPRQNLRVLTMNCQSIRNKRTDLAECIDYFKPDVILGCESWLSSEHKNAEIFPDGYHKNIYRKDRNKNGGGVFIAVHDSFETWEVENSNSNCEIVWIEMQTKTKNIVLGCFYRPPSADIANMEELDISLKNVIGKSKEKITILGGDFNLPHINWTNLSVNPGSIQTNQHHQLLEIAEDAGLQQMQLHATRQSNNLDLYFTNYPTLVKSCDTAPGFSDHDLVVTDSDIKPKYNKPKRRKIFKYNKANWTSINTKMEELSNKIINMKETINTRWNVLKSGIMDTMNDKIPSKLSSKGHSMPWISSKLKKSIRRKHKLYQQARQSQKQKDWATYKLHKKKLQKDIRNAHWKYVNETLNKNLEEGNNKSFWKYIKAKRNDNIGVAAIKNNGILYHDSSTKAELLNAQFKSVFTVENPDSELPEIAEQSYPSIPELNITVEGVYKLLSQLNTKKASGPDNIPNMMLKTCAKELAPAITSIFQQSIDTGELPTDWQNANVSPIFKKGNKHLPSNYRPVSLTSVCCKTLEHIICKFILNHLEKYNIFTHLQHGFRSGHSCETQLINTMHDIMKSNDKKEQIDLVILDFSKAFDTVPHRKLLHKLSNYGIRGNINNWIRNFLMNRHQRVVIDGVSSLPCSVDSGVPQGTVLGPLLFLCHINDLPKSVTSQVRLFADDCLLYRTVKSLDDHLKLQQDLDSLQKWAQTWGMKFNEAKCYIMSIHRKKQPSNYNYLLNNQILEQVSENPYLGVIISDNLKWSAHISKICSRANSILGFIKRNLKHSTSSFKETAYISLVRSILDYSSTVWDPYLQKDINSLESVQRRAARFVHNDYHRKSSVTNMMKSLGWKPLAERRREQRLLLLFKIVNDLVALPTDSLDLELNNRTQRKLNSKCFKPITCNTEILKNSFVPRTIKDWNILPETCVNCKKIPEFKSAISNIHTTTVQSD